MDAVLQSLAPAAAAGLNPDLWESHGLAKRSFPHLLDCGVTDLHLHALLFVQLAGAVFKDLSAAGGTVLETAAMPLGFQIQSVHMASALSAYQSYRHNCCREMDDALYEVDSDIAARQAAMVRPPARVPLNVLPAMRTPLSALRTRAFVVISDCGVAE